MTLKEKVFEHIKKHGPQTNADLVAKFKVMKASMRRTCGELAKEGKITPLPSDGSRLWGITADERALPRAEDLATGTPANMPPPSPADKRSEPPLDPKDWRMTDFCF